MDGTKLEQLKAAMYTVLQELHENDTFSFVEFESVIRVWDLDQTSVTVDWSADLQVCLIKLQQLLRTCLNISLAESPVIIAAFFSCQQR